MTTTEEIPNEALAIALCSAADRAEQARLFNACFKKDVEAEHLAWRYDENPHGSAVSLVSRPPGGEGICGYACSPRLAVPGGDRSAARLVGQTGDVMTHPDWRKRGIFSGLDAACMEAVGDAGWALAFGLPNRRSAHIFQKLGWETIGKVRPYTFVLRADAASRKARLVDGRLRSLLVPMAAAAGRLARRKLRKRAGSGYEVRPLDAFPLEVDELSGRIERDFDFMVRRDAAYLNWRFLRNPSGRHRAFGVYDRDEHFCGYVVIELPRDGSPAGYLVDVLAPDPAALAAALEGALVHLAAAGASYVQATALDDSWWRSQLLATGFQPPKADNHLIVILYPHDPDHALVAAARDTSRWYFTDGDRDDETMG
jgi:GNAT superfamily N-acetyltransferase